MGDEKAGQGKLGKEMAKLLREKWPELLFIVVILAVIIAIYSFVL